MLRFFRRLRRGLLSENRYSKYLLYALGEIFLVVIGILIALQINSWNEEYKNRKLEKDYLARLVNDLDLDASDLGSVIQRACINLVLAEDLLVKIGADTSILPRGNAYDVAHQDVTIFNKKIYYKDSITSPEVFNIAFFGRHLTQLTKGRGFDLTQTTFNDLMSTGKIEVIRDKQLREAIQSYYGRMQTEVGNESDLVVPHARYLQHLLNDLGIVPFSKLTVENVKRLAHQEKRLATAIFNIYHANHTLIRINSTNEDSLYNCINELRMSIDTFLASL